MGGYSSISYQKKGMLSEGISFLNTEIEPSSNPIKKHNTPTHQRDSLR